MAKLFLLYLVIYLAASRLAERQIKSLNILLPVTYANSDYKIQYLMEAYGGCYIWSTNQPKVISVTGIITSGDCESKSIVRLNHVGNFQSPLKIFALDKESQQTIKADVRLGKLSKIEIVTTFKIMNVGQSQQFYVIGYDDDQNTFSSLQGFRFEWTITQAEPFTEKVTIKDSGIHQQTNYRKNLEKINYETDMLVIKALRIGQVKISVRVNQHKYEHVQNSIRISVQQRFEIVPASPVYLLASSRYSFRLINAKYQFIPLPSRIYKATIGKNYLINERLQVLTPEGDSETSLIVSDPRTQPAYISEAKIYSLRPDQLNLNVSEYIIVGKQSIYQMSFYQKRIQLNGTVNVSVTGDFVINKQRSTILAKNKLVGKIKLQYLGLFSQKKIIANLPLKSFLLNNQLVLPLSQNYNIQILGGSGQFEYRVQPQNLATVSAGGLLKTLTIGTGVIKVVDKKDQNNYMEIKLVVDRIKTLKSIEERKQFIVGEESQIFAIASPLNSGWFNQCDDIDIALETANSALHQQQIHHNSTLLINKLKVQATRNPSLKALLQKHSTIKITLDDYLKQFQDYIQASQISRNQLKNIYERLENFGICRCLTVKGLKSSQQTFNLKFVNKQKVQSTPFEARIYDQITNSFDTKYKQIIIPPLAKLQWIFKGGPAKWETEPIRQINRKMLQKAQSIMVACQNKVQTLDFQLKIYNQGSFSLPRPVLQTKRLTINCKYPSRLSIWTDAPLVDGLVKIPENKTFQILLIGFDQNKNQFFDVSNLEFNWILEGVKKIDNTSAYRFELLKSDAYKIKVASNKILNDKNLKFPPVQDQLSLTKISTFVLESQNCQLKWIQLLLNKQNRKSISIRGGSGSFSINCASDILLFSVKDRTITIIPFKVGQTEIIVNDNQAYGRQSITIKVSVIKAAKLIINSNLHLVQENNKFQIGYQVYDHEQRQVSISEYKYLDFKITTDCPLQEISRRDNKVEYLAKRQSICNIAAYINQVPKIDSKNQLEIQIFKRFSPSVPGVKQLNNKSHPVYAANISVALGCNSFLTFYGGPERRLNLEISKNPEGVVAVKEYDQRNYELIGINKGQTVLRFILYQDQNKILSESIIRVVVKQINGLSIMNSDQQREIYEGSQIRLLPELLIDGVGIIQSACKYVFEWKTNNHDTINLVSYSPENKGVNITGLKEGIAFVEVALKLGTKQLFKASKQIKVIKSNFYEMPRFIHQKPFSAVSLLVPPNSGIQIGHYFTVEKINECDTLLIVDKNRIYTQNQKGASAILLRQKEAQKVLTGVNVLVTKIHSLFIENINGILNLQLDTEVKVKFYIQDSFGRLFNNNLFNVNYLVKSADPKILAGYLSQDKEHIYLKGNSIGQTELYVSIENQNIYDLVPVRIGNLIKPESPIWIHVGGTVNFMIENNKIGSWESQNESIFKFESKSSKGIALKEGSTNALYREAIVYKSKINVFVISEIIKIEPKQALSNLNNNQFKLKYRLFGLNKGTKTAIKLLNTPNQQINNNLKLKCETLNPDWFEVRQEIGKIDEDTQLPFCIVKPVAQYPESQIPNSLKITLIVYNNQYFKIIQHFSYPFHFEFRIDKSDETINMNSNKLTKTISIKTNVALEVSAQGSKHDWFTSEFNKNLGLQIIKIKFNKFDPYLKEYLNIENPHTKQKQKVKVVYSSTGNSDGWYSFRWTDLLIIPMIIIVVLFLVSSRNSNKMHDD